MSVLAEVQDREGALREQVRVLFKRWLAFPPLFAEEALQTTLDPWQCDVMDALYEYDNVAIQACRGPGKTTIEACIITHFTTMHDNARVPTTAPVFNKQVKDVLWAEIHERFRLMQQGPGKFLADGFDILSTRLQHRERPSEWFAVGIASSKATNTEGYRSKHVLVVFDEAKGIQKPVWDSIQGIRTLVSQEGALAKFLVGSTPGGPTGEFFKVMTQYRSTWKALFVIHPEALRATIKKPEVVGTHPDTGEKTVGMFSPSGGVYYSRRISPQWVEDRRQEWGYDSPIFQAHAVGVFPEGYKNALIQYSWLTAAEARERGAEGEETWISCDVARSGMDRTVCLAGRGGTVLAGETVARNPDETTVPEARVAFERKRYGRKHPYSRSIIATANLCQRMAIDWGAVGVCVDGTGLGGGVADELHDRGLRVIEVAFNEAPTDKPRTEEERKWRKLMRIPETTYKNIKAQMGFALATGFENGWVALANLACGECRAAGGERASRCRHILDPLIAQASLMRHIVNSRGLLELVDPDASETDSEWAQILGTEEITRSPDHFHSLMLLWRATCMTISVEPQAKAILPSNIIGHGPSSAFSERPLPMASRVRQGVGGPAAYLKGMYRGRRR